MATAQGQGPAGTACARIADTSNRMTPRNDVRTARVRNAAPGWCVSEIQMNLAISIAGESLDSPFDPRFGRAPAFCLVDLETGSWQILPNPGVSASGGAGVQAAQFIAQQDAHLVASGAFGPKAFAALTAAGIQMFVPPDKDGLVGRDILSQYERGDLTAVTTPSHEGHIGGRP